MKIGSPPGLSHADLNILPTIRVEGMEVVPTADSLVQPSELMKRIEGFKFHDQGES